MLYKNMREEEERQALGRRKLKSRKEKGMIMNKKDEKRKERVKNLTTKKMI